MLVPTKPTHECAHGRAGNKLLDIPGHVQLRWTRDSQNRVYGNHDTVVNHRISTEMTFRNPYQTIALPLPQWNRRYLADLNQQFKMYVNGLRDLVEVDQPKTDYWTRSYKPSQFAISNNLLHRRNCQLGPTLSWISWPRETPVWDTQLNPHTSKTIASICHTNSQFSLTQYSLLLQAPIWIDLQVSRVVKLRWNILIPPT